MSSINTPKTEIVIIDITIMFQEFSDLMGKIPNHPSFFDYLFFLAFLFFVVIVLMNLLTGLAVSDVALIKNQAEVISYKSQVNLICTAEAILLDDPYNFLSNGTTCEWINKIPTNECWEKMRGCGGVARRKRPCSDFGFEIIFTALTKRTAVLGV